MQTTTNQILKLIALSLACGEASLAMAHSGHGEPHGLGAETGAHDGASETKGLGGRSGRGRRVVLGLRGGQRGRGAEVNVQAMVAVGATDEAAGAEVGATDEAAGAELGSSSRVGDGGGEAGGESVGSGVVVGDAVGSGVG